MKNDNFVGAGDANKAMLLDEAGHYDLLRSSRLTKKYLELVGHIPDFFRLKGGNVIFACVVGSHAYGTNVEGSDVDVKGVYLQDAEDILNNGYREQESFGKDCTFYELRRFLELCLKGNPTMLEILYSPEDCILYKHEVFNPLIEHRDKMLSKSCRWSYGGYAMDQIKKAKGLDKMMNWEKADMQRKSLLDFTYAYIQKMLYTNGGKEFKGGTTVPIKEYLKAMGYKQEFVGLTSIPHVRFGYNMYYDHVRDMKSDNPKFREQHVFQFKGIVSNEETSTSVLLSEVPKYYSNMVECMVVVNSDEYSVHCKRYKQYQEWLKNRNEQRYVDIKNHGQKIDGKNLLHCIRLLETGLQIAETGTLTVRRPNADFLVEIRKGKHDLDTIIARGEELITQIDEKFEKSDLPHSADRSFFMSLMPKIRKEFVL